MTESEYALMASKRPRDSDSVSDDGQPQLSQQPPSKQQCSSSQPARVVNLPGWETPTIPKVLWPDGRVRSINVSGRLGQRGPLEKFSLQKRDLTHLKLLHVNHQRLTRFPRPMSGLLGVKYLSLRNNCLKTVPDTALTLPHIKYLDLSLNPTLVSFPMICTSPLEILKLSDSKLTSIPEFVMSCAQTLRTLDLSKNSLRRFPEDVNRLTNLQSLNLSGNANLTWTVPASFKLLERLRIRGTLVKICRRGSFEAFAVLEVGDDGRFYDGDFADHTNADLALTCAGLRELIGSLGRSTLTLLKRCRQRLEYVRLKWNHWWQTRQRTDGLVSWLETSQPNLEFLSIKGLHYQSHGHRRSLQQVRMPMLITLHLSGMNLTNIPGGLGGNLKSLNLSKNYIPEVPASIISATKLRNLNLSRNRIVTVASEIEHLTNLTSLHLKFNCIKEIPTTIGGLSHLTILDLSRNCISLLPSELGKLHKLRNLQLECNRLTDLPTTIGDLHELGHLDLSINKLSELPPAIGRLSKLEDLYVSKNELSTLPIEIDKCEKLKRLYFADNKIRRLTPLLYKQPISRIGMTRNCLEELPEILSGYLLDNTQNYFMDMETLIGHLGFIYKTIRFPRLNIIREDRSVGSFICIRKFRSFYREAAEMFNMCLQCVRIIMIHRLRGLLETPRPHFERNPKKKDTRSKEREDRSIPHELFLEILEYLFPFGQDDLSGDSWHSRSRVFYKPVRYMSS